MSFHSFGHCYFSMYTGLWRTALLQLIFFLILYTFQYLFSVLLDIFLIIWVCFILHDTLHIKRWGYYSKSSDFNNTTYSFCLFTYLLIYLLKMCLHLSNQTICSYLHKFCSFCLFFLKKTDRDLSFCSNYRAWNLQEPFFRQLFDCSKP